MISRARRTGCRVAALSAAAMLIAGAVRGDEGAPEPSANALAWTVLAYLPNRLCDLADIVRLRARVGTGFAAGARVTRRLPAFAGDYRAFWLGLPGPRGRPELPIPLGLEGQKGVEIGPLRTSRTWRSPQYGVGEVGFGVMVYALGFDVGVDPYELGDFLAGLLLVDYAHDDF